MAEGGEDEVERGSGRGLVDGAGRVGDVDAWTCVGGLSEWIDERLTLCSTLQHVDLIVPRPIVRDPFDSPRLGERTDDYLVKHADPNRGSVVTVDPDDTVVFAARFQAREKVGAVGRVHELLQTTNGVRICPMGDVGV